MCYTEIESRGDASAEVSFTQILHVNRSHENKGTRLTSLQSIALTDAHSCPADDTHTSLSSHIRNTLLLYAVG